MQGKHQSPSGAGEDPERPASDGSTLVWAVPPYTANLIAHRGYREGGGQHVDTLCGRHFSAVALFNYPPRVVHLCPVCRKAQP